MFNFRAALLTSAIVLGSALPATAGSGIIHTGMQSQSGATQISFRGTGCNDYLRGILLQISGLSGDVFTSLYEEEIFQVRATVRAGGRSYIRTACMFGSERSDQPDFFGIFLEDTADNKPRESCMGVIGIEETSDATYDMFLSYLANTAFGNCPVKGETSELAIQGIGTNGYRVGNSQIANSF